MNYSNLTDRFKDAPWFRGACNEHIILVGSGGIGSNTLLALTKTVPAIYYAIDNDIVESYNIGTQMFTMDQVGKPKVAAIKSTCSNQSDTQVNPIKQFYSNDWKTPIMITGLDNMKARKEVYKAWKSKDNRELLLDGRMRANLYEVYAVTKDNQEEYEKTLFDDSEVDDGPCTFKQTAYVGFLIAGRITQILVNYLTNKYSEETICTVPFKVQEFTEPFFIDVV